MGGSRRVARLAFMWGLMAVSGATSATAQEATQAKPAPRPQVFLVPQSSSSTNQSFNMQAPASPTTQRAEARRAGPWLPQPWQPVQNEKAYAVSSLSDNHTIVISTLGLIIAGAVLLILLL